MPGIDIRRVLKNASILGIGNLFAPLLAFLLLPIVTGIYTASDFGLLGAVLAAATILGNALTLKLELALPGATTHARKLSLLTVSSLVLLGMVILLISVSILLYLLAEIDLEIILLLLLSAASIGLLNLHQHYRLSLNNIKRVASAKAASSTEPIAQILVADLAYTFKLGFSFLIAQLLALGCVLNLRARLLWRFIRNRRATRELIHRNQKYVFMSTPAYLVNTSALHGIPILFAVFLDTGIVGEMLVFQRTAGAVIFLLSGILGQIFITEFSINRAEAGNRASVIYFQCLLLNVVIALGLYWVVIFFAPLFDSILGGEWNFSPELFLPLTLLYCVQLIAVPLSQTLNLVGRQEWQLIWDLVRMAVVVGGVILCINRGLTSYEVLSFYCVLMVAMYVVLLAIQCMFLKYRSSESGYV